MPPTADNPPLSDTETAEKPVREQFKKASIAGLPRDVRTANEPIGDTQVTVEPASENGSRGRMQRKRSFEEVESEQTEETASGTTVQHTRKRSRDSTTEEKLANNGHKTSGERPGEDAEATAAVAVTNGETAPAAARPGTPVQSSERRVEDAAEDIASPKTKRSRLHSSLAEDKSVAPEAETEKAAPVPTGDVGPPPAEASASKIPPTGGFANTSATSPFGALTGAKSPASAPAQMSSTAFTASGFGSLASSTSSGFSAIGKSSGGFGTGGGFGTKDKSASGAPAEPSAENEKPETTASGFGGALGQQSAFSAAPAASTGFGSGTASFSKLGGGFGSGFGGGSAFGGASTSGLTTFASSKTPAPLGSSSRSARPFGAPLDDEEEAGDEAGGEDDSSGVKSPAALSQDEEKQDERFYAQQLETGEEDEATEFQCRAKVYNYTVTDAESGKKEWRERGLGMLRFNVNRGGEVPKARFLMRADGSHRVVLNTPVKKEIKIGAAMGGPPQGGLMAFLGTVEGGAGLEMLQVK
ncbi:hypothetical protein LTR53_015403, partial [Teratosphaeriaceae sp. CCFEE 6253]